MVSEVNDNLDNKLKEMQTNENHEESIPMGYSNYDFNAFGLLREEIPSVKKVNYEHSKNLDNAKFGELVKILPAYMSGMIVSLESKIILMGFFPFT